jgi:hypothetical protein
MQEKRKTVRVEKTLTVQYAHHSTDPFRSLSWDTTTAKNISIEGILLNSNKLFAKKEKLQLRFAIPTDPYNQLEVVGEVIETFTPSHEIRIKFINLGEPEKKIIGDYVGYLLKNNKKLNTQGG